MDEKNKKDWLVRICCFIAAFSLWLYVSNVDNTKKTASINVPVELLNVDAISQGKLIVVPGQKISITLKIKGQSIDVYSAKPDQFKIIADMGTFSLKKGENRIPVEVRNSPENVNVVNTDLWVKVNLDALVEKSVPVKTNLDVKTKSGYYSSEPIPKPSQVIITGPSTFVNSVQYVMAKKGDIKDIDKDTYLTLPLQAMDGSGRVINEVKIEPTTVEVLIPIKKSKSVTVNLKTKGNLPNGITLKSINLVNEKVEITGTQADLNKINSIDTEDINMNGINSSGTIKVKLIIPDNVAMLNGNGYVNVSANIDKVIQNTITKDIQIKNLGQNLEAKLDKTKITLVIQGNETVLNNLKIESIICYVDLNGKLEGDLVVEVIIPPVDGVTILSSDIKTVNVKLIKK